MTGQIAIITGASRGIGQAVAVHLAEAGADIVAVARGADALGATRDRVEATGRRRCLAAATDITDASAVQALFEDIDARFGRVDILVNNAGQAVLSTMDNFDLAQFDAMLDVNVRGLFYMTRAAWSRMVAGGGGSIVNLSSLAAADPFPGFQAYGASKAWVEALTRSTATEGRPHGIRVYAIAPGAVDTPMLRGHFPDFPSDQCLSPDDIARSVVWVLSPHSTHASGAVVAVRQS